MNYDLAFYTLPLITARLRDLGSACRHGPLPEPTVDQLEADAGALLRLVSHAEGERNEAVRVVRRLLDAFAELRAAGIRVPPSVERADHAAREFLVGMMVSVRKVNEP